MDLPTLVDISLGGMALALYRQVSPLLKKTTELVDLLEIQIDDHEKRIVALEKLRD
jgi:c-di-GMP-binding flagellar brake protein YcgR